MVAPSIVYLESIAIHYCETGMGVHKQLSLGLGIPQQLDYCTLPHCELASLHSHVLWLVKLIWKTLAILTFSRVLANRLFRWGQRDVTLWESVP